VERVVQGDGFSQEIGLDENIGLGKVGQICYLVYEGFVRYYVYDVVIVLDFLVDFTFI
jgi:hypothetical protein